MSQACLHITGLCSFSGLTNLEYIHRAHIKGVSIHAPNLKTTPAYAHDKSIAPAEADLRMNYGLLVWPSASNPHHSSARIKCQQVIRLQTIALDQYSFKTFNCNQFKLVDCDRRLADPGGTSKAYAATLRALILLFTSRNLPQSSASGCTVSSLHVSGSGLRSHARY